MSSTAVRRTALAASAAALALLVTACGGSSDDDGAAGDDKAKAERSAPAEGAGASAPAGKALTAAELEKVVLAQADVKNGEVATELSADDRVAKDQISVDDKSCLPLVHAQGAVAQGKPAADVQRSWQGQSESPSQSKGPDGQDMTDVDVNKIMLNVASYADGGAEQAMAGLKAAVEKCAGGFDATVGSDRMRVTEVSGSGRLKAGDEGLTVNIGVATGGDGSGLMKLVAVRKGATLATFSAVNLSSMMTGAEFQVPAEVVDAQVAKLG
ncbi:Lipoprotein OS=Streptomyces tendae OX=1932 GN=GUR47_17040 PE=4 SV=1 [Streptomyces tendae]